jgi:hypothetical protein
LPKITFRGEDRKWLAAAVCGRRDLRGDAMAADIQSGDLVTALDEAAPSSASSCSRC